MRRFFEVPSLRYSIGGASILGEHNTGKQAAARFSLFLQVRRTMDAEARMEVVSCLTYRYRGNISWQRSSRSPRLRVRASRARRPTPRRLPRRPCTISRRPTGACNARGAASSRQARTRRRTGAVKSSTGRSRLTAIASLTPQNEAAPERRRLIITQMLERPLQLLTWPTVIIVLPPCVVIVSDV